MRKLTLLLCALLAGISLAVAQTSISGTVLTAEDDEPVIGASILVKGTNASTITDNDGKFSIKIPEGAGRTLVITYIGMERQEVFARNGMVVKLTSSDQALDDVVVVGYQTIRKEAKTGSIATVKGDDLYVILTEWQERPFEIRGVKKPRNISLLGTDRKIKSSYSGEKLTIMPPVMNFTEVPCQHAWVYKLENVFKK